MCLTPGVTILYSTTEKQLVLDYQCNFGAPVWISKASMYLQISLVLFTALYINLISPPVDSESIVG